MESTEYGELSKRNAPPCQRTLADFLEHSLHAGFVGGICQEASYITPPVSKLLDLASTSLLLSPDIHEFEIRFDHNI
jgi:hypothetical protein